jgi:DMSO/TMAO reductase YedYZ molybdopterin-dependent catalytic subunit
MAALEENTMTEEATDRKEGTSTDHGPASLVVVKYSPFNAESPPAALSEDITPMAQFYVRSNFDVPALDPNAWRLRVDGAVNGAFEISLDDLRALPSRTLTATLECAGNSRTGLAPLPQGEPWGSGAVSTAGWRGVPVSSVLERADLRPEAVEVVFEGADGGKVEGGQQTTFARSLPVERALHPDTLLVYEMNGAPLPPEHGGPMRLVVPGWYGMASVKWVVRIAAVEQPFAGYFQAQRYVFDVPGSATREPLREMRVKSMITAPVSGSVLPLGPQIVSGFAWSGAGAIRSVEVSVEGAGEWRPARLAGASTPYAWRRWEFEWTPTRPGRHVLRSRATDEQGNIQPDAAQWNRLGYANNAIHIVSVMVDG